MEHGHKDVQSEESSNLNLSKGKFGVHLVSLVCIGAEIVLVLSALVEGKRPRRSASLAPTLWRCIQKLLLHPMPVCSAVGDEG